MIRNFLLAVTLLLTIQSFAQKSKKGLLPHIGMVSYTYRHSFQKDVAATLDTIKALGISDMEFSNLFGQTAENLRRLLDERGMTCSSFGVSYDDLVNKTDEVAQNAKTLGASFVRVAWVPHTGQFTLANAQKVVEDFNKAGRKLKEEYGLTFCYHNHGYEFQPHAGGTLFDYIVQQTNPEYVSFEMDILWVFHPGQDPVQLLKKYGNRFKLMHVKDLRKGVKGDLSGYTPVENDVTLGTGQLNLPSILKAAVKAGVQRFYIEDESPSVSVQVPQSIAYLKSLKK